MANILDKYILEAERLFEEDQIDDAEKLLLELLFEEPDFAKAHNHLGWLYLYKKENYDLSELHLKYSIKFAPDYAPAYLHAGHLKWKQNKLEEAEEYFKTGSDLKNAEKATFLEQIALLAEHTNHYKKAIQYFEKAILESTNTYFVDECKNAIKRIRKKRSIKFWNWLKLRFR